MKLRKAICWKFAPIGGGLAPPTYQVAGLNKGPGDELEVQYPGSKLVPEGLSPASLPTLRTRDNEAQEEAKKQIPVV